MKRFPGICPSFFSLHFLSILLIKEQRWVCVPMIALGIYIALQDGQLRTSVCAKFFFVANLKNKKSK